MAWGSKKLQFFILFSLYLTCSSSFAANDLVNNTKDYIVLRTMADAARWEAFFSKSPDEQNSLGQLAQILDLKATRKFEEIKNPLEKVYRHVETYMAYHFIVRLVNAQREQAGEAAANILLESFAKEFHVTPDDILRIHEKLHALFGDNFDFIIFDKNIDLLITAVQAVGRGDATSFQAEIAKIPEGPFKDLLKAAWRQVSEEQNKRQKLFEEFGSRELDFDRYLSGAFQGPGTGQDYIYYKRLNEFWPDLRKLLYANIREKLQLMQWTPFQGKSTQIMSDIFNATFPENPEIVSHELFYALLSDYVAACEKRDRQEPVYVFKRGSGTDYWSSWTGQQPSVLPLSRAMLTLTATMLGVEAALITSFYSAWMLGPVGTLVVAGIAATFASAPNLNHVVYGEPLPNEGTWTGRFIMNLVFMLPLAACFQVAFELASLTTTLVGVGLVGLQTVEFLKNDQYFESYFSALMLFGMGAQRVRIIRQPYLTHRTSFDGLSISENIIWGTNGVRVRPGRTQTTNDILNYSFSYRNEPYRPDGYLYINLSRSKNVYIQERTGLPSTRGPPPDEPFLGDDGFIIPRGNPRTPLEGQGAYYEETIATDPGILNGGQPTWTPQESQGPLGFLTRPIGDIFSPSSSPTPRTGSVSILPEIIPARPQVEHAPFTSILPRTTILLPSQGQSNNTGSIYVVLDRNIFGDYDFSPILSETIVTGEPYDPAKPVKKFIVIVENDPNGNGDALILKIVEEDSEEHLQALRSPLRYKIYGFGGAPSTDSNAVMASSGSTSSGASGSGASSSGSASRDDAEEEIEVSESALCDILLGDASIQKKLKALELLNQLEKEVAIALLVQAIQEAREKQLQKEAALQLVRMGEGVRGTVETLLGSTDPFVKRVMIYAVGEVKFHLSHHILMQLLIDKNRRVKLAAIQLFAGLGEAARATLEAMLKDDPDPVIKKAIELILYVGALSQADPNAPVRHTEGVLLKLLASRDWGSFAEEDVENFFGAFQENRSRDIVISEKAELLLHWLFYPSRDIHEGLAEMPYEEMVVTLREAARALDQLTFITSRQDEMPPAKIREILLLDRVAAYAFQRIYFVFDDVLEHAYATVQGEARDLLFNRDELIKQLVYAHGPFLNYQAIRYLEKIDNASVAKWAYADSLVARAFEICEEGQHDYALYEILFHSVDDVALAAVRKLSKQYQAYKDQNLLHLLAEAVENRYFSVKLRKVALLALCELTDYQYRGLDRLAGNMLLASDPRDVGATELKKLAIGILARVLHLQENPTVNIKATFVKAFLDGRESSEIKMVLFNELVMMVTFAEALELAARLPEPERTGAINLLDARFKESQEFRTLGGATQEQALARVVAFIRANKKKDAQERINLFDDFVRTFTFAEGVFLASRLPETDAEKVLNILTERFMERRDYKEICGGVDPRYYVARLIIDAARKESIVIESRELLEFLINTSAKNYQPKTQQEGTSQETSQEKKPAESWQEDPYLLKAQKQYPIDAIPASDPFWSDPTRAGFILPNTREQVWIGSWRNGTAIVFGYSHVVHLDFKMKMDSIHRVGDYVCFQREDAPDIYYFNLALSDAPHPQFSNAEGTNQGVTLLNPLQQDARLTPTLRVDWRRPRPHVFAEDQTGSFGDINQFAMPTASELEPWRENMHALPILFMFAGVPQAHRVSKVRFNETTGELLLYEAANNEEKVFMTLSKTQLDIYSAFLLQVFSYSDVMAHPAFVLAWREEFNRLTQVIEAQTGVKGVGEVFGQVVQRLSPIEEEIHFETMQHDEKFKAQLAKGDKLVAEPFAKILKGTTYLFDSEGIPIAARRFDQNQRITEVRPLTRQQKNDAMEYIERVEDKKFENDPTHRKLVSAMKEDIEGALKTMRKSIKNAFVPENGAEHFDKDVMAGHFLEPHRYFPDMRALSRGERAHLPDNAEEAVVALSREVRPVAPTNEEMRDAMAGSGTSHMMESFLSEVQRTRERMEKAQPGRLHEVETELDLYDYLKQKGPYELKGKNQKERRRGFFRKPVHPKGLVAWQFENDTELNGSVNSLPLRLFHTEEGGAAVLAPSGSPYRTIRLKFGENTMTDSVKTVREFNVETQGVVACGNFLVFLPPEGSTGRKAISRVIDLSTYVNADLIPRFFMPFQVDLSKAHIVEARGNHDKITLKYEDYETREVKETVVLLSDIEDIVREQTKLHMRFSAFADFAHFDSPKFQERIQEVREALKEALASETLKAPEAVALEIDAALDEFVDTAIHLRSLEAAEDTPLLQKKKKIGLILQETTAKLAKRYKFFGRMGLATQILNDYEPLQGRGLLACILIAAASISVAHAVSPDAVQEHAMQVTHIMYAMSQAFTNAISEGFFLAAEAAKDMFAFFKPSVFKELLSHRAAIAITAALGGTFLGVGVVMSLAQGYGVWKSRRDPEYESFEERWIKEKEKSKESLHYVKRLRIADAARCRNAYYAAKLKGTLLENEGWTEFKDRWIEEQRGKGEGDGGLVVETVICPRDRRALNRDYLLFIQKEEAIRNGMTPMEADELTYRQAVIRLFWSYAGFKGLLAITTRAQNYFNYAKNSISWDTPFNIFFPEIKATALRGATPRFENGAWRFQVFPRLLPYEKRAREQYLLLGELKLREKVALCAMDETYRYMKDERDKFEAEKKQVGPPLKRDELHDFLRTLKPQGQLFLRVLYNELFIRLYGRVVAFHDEHHGELPLTDTLIERWVQEIKGEVSVEAQDYVEKNPVIRFWDSLKYRDVRFRIANFIVQRFSKPSYFKKRLLEFKDAMANDPQALERAARETLSTIKVDKWQDYIFLILLGLGSSGEQAPLQPEFMGPLSFCYLSRRRWNNVVWDIYHTLFGGPWIKVLQDINLRNSAEVFDKEFNERPKNPNISFARHYFNSTFSRENSWWHNQKRSLQMSFSNWKSYVINLIILSLPALGFIDIESILFGYTLGAILGGWYMMLEQGFERATGYALTDITDQQLRDPYMQQIARQRLQRLRDRFNLVQNFYFNIEGMFQTIFFYNAVADPNTGQNVYRAGMKFLMRPLFGDKGMAGWLHEEFKELAQEYPSMADTLHSLDTVFTKNHPDFAKPDGMYYQDTHPGTAEAPLPSGD